MRPGTGHGARRRGDRDGEFQGLSQMRLDGTMGVFSLPLRRASERARALGCDQDQAAAASLGHRRHTLMLCSQPSIEHRTAPHHSALHCTALHRTALAHPRSSKCPPGRRKRVSLAVVLVSTLPPPNECVAVRLLRPRNGLAVRKLLFQIALQDRNPVASRRAAVGAARL